VRTAANGQKTWIPAAHVAEHLLVLTREDSTRGKHAGLTLLMVPTRTPGLTIRAIPTVEAHTVNDVFFDDGRVPASAVVGTAVAAWKQLMRGLIIERLIIAAMGLGGVQRALDDALAYVQQPEQFGVPIGSFGLTRASGFAEAIRWCCTKAGREKRFLSLAPTSAMRRGRSRRPGDSALTGVSDIASLVAPV
jgi:acyl-CoA dehydrogenase